jgi:RNA polymerase sigma-70 factor (ECF subfamily)
LHDVFEMPFDQVADVLRRDSAAVRQLAARARKHIDAGKPRFDASSADQQRITAAFWKQPAPAIRQAGAFAGGGCGA